MPSANHIKRWIAIGGLLSFSFAGLAFCQLVEWLCFENERQMMQHPFWSKAILDFAVVFLLGLALVPVQILVFERRERANRPLPQMRLSDVVGIPLGVYNGDARVPNWIKIPVLAVLFVLLSVFLLILFLGLLTVIL